MSNDKRICSSRSYNKCVCTHQSTYIYKAKIEISEGIKAKPEENFNVAFSITGRIFGQKINQKRADLSITTDQMNLPDIYRIFYP
jgi:hypothetical protein